MAQFGRVTRVSALCLRGCGFDSQQSHSHTKDRKMVLAALLLDIGH